MPNGKKRHHVKPAVKLAAKADFISGNGSRAEIAQRYKVNPLTISSWAKREGWCRAKLDSEAKVQAHVDLKTAIRAESMANRAAQFLERCAKESESWLDQVQQTKALVSPADVASVSQLIQAWKVPIAVGRQTYGLDSENAGTRVQVAVFSKDGVEVIAKAQTSQTPDVDVQDGQS